MYTYYNGAPRGSGDMCYVCKNHLLAMCYVSFCSHCYVELKYGAMQKYNMCYVLCKSCTKVLCMNENVFENI